MYRHPPQPVARRPVNLSVDAQLLSEARSWGINLSALLERVLAAELRQQKRLRWLAENSVGIAAYNREVELQALLGEHLRQF